MIRLPTELVASILADEDLKPADILSILLTNSTFRVIAEQILYTHVILPPSNALHASYYKRMIDTSRLALQLRFLTIAVESASWYPADVFGNALSLFVNLKELVIHQPGGSALHATLPIQSKLRSTSLPFSLRVLRVALNTGLHGDTDLYYPIFVQRDVEHLELYAADYFELTSSSNSPYIYRYLVTIRKRGQSAHTSMHRGCMLG